MWITSLSGSLYLVLLSLAHSWERVHFYDVGTNKYIDRHLITILIVNPDWKRFIIFFFYFIDISFNRKTKVRRKKCVLRLVE